MDPKSKSDWSDIDDMLKRKNATEADTAWSSEEMGPTPTAATSGLPAPVEQQRQVALQAERSLRTRIRAGAIEREKVIKQLQIRADREIEAFDHHVKNAVTYYKTKSDVLLREKLAELEARELKTLRECRIHNEVARFETLLETDQKFVGLIKEARERDLPDTWFQENIHDLTEIRRRLRAQINEDFGSRHRPKME